MHWLRIARYYNGEVEAPRSFLQARALHAFPSKRPVRWAIPCTPRPTVPKASTRRFITGASGREPVPVSAPTRSGGFNFYDYRTWPGITGTCGAKSRCHRTFPWRHGEVHLLHAADRVRPCCGPTRRTGRSAGRRRRHGFCQARLPNKGDYLWDINDPNSEVSRLRRDGRHYAAFGGTRKRGLRTTYLARWRDNAGGEG